ncbi:MAG: ATP-binding cassette domain-containing protein [Alphaproteobacteria bacterium]|nr:ATP-binding cassette domain-containing protein [Alphaproteobacteria bacterium]
MDASAPQPLIALSGIEVSLPSEAGLVHILRGIDLDVADGEAVGLVGPSGSGKSTLLMVLAGLERPTAGEVRVAGRTFAGMDEDALALFRRDNIGVVFQSFHLIATMTALENVAVPLEFAGRRDAFDRAGAELEAVGLGHRLGHYPSQLSGGEQQRVALARAVAAGPKLLLADEPTGNLDGATGAAVIDLIFARHARLGTTLVLITHDVALASACDRIVQLKDGRIESIAPGAGRGALAAR